VGILEIHLAHTQGFCAGVSYAINIVEQVIHNCKPPIYVRHHIVHNTLVINDFKRRGVVFVESLSQIPDHSIVVFSAHGVAPCIYEEAAQKKLRVIDATCPLVAKIHERAKRLSDEGGLTVLIGHKNHQEVIGTAGYIHQDQLAIVENESDVDLIQRSPNQKIGYITQTTLSLSETAGIVERLKIRFPDLIESSQKDICYATRNRQLAVHELAQQVELMIICGSPESSNSNRLKEVAKRFTDTVIIDYPRELDMFLLKDKKKIGISSGASVPQYVIDELIKRILSAYPDSPVYQAPSIEKDISFKIPKFLFG